MNLKKTLRWIRCKLGFHQWRTAVSMNCKVWASSIFWAPRQVGCKAKIQVCSCCPTIRGLLDTPVGKEPWDVDELIVEAKKLDLWPQV